MREYILTHSGSSCQISFVSSYSISGETANLKIKRVFFFKTLYSCALSPQDVKHKNDLIIHLQMED